MTLREKVSKLRHDGKITNDEYKELTNKLDEYDKNSIFENEVKETSRCEGCAYARTVYTNGNWKFIGCYHRPYTGKWVAEIKECPRGKEGAV